MQLNDGRTKTVDLNTEPKGILPLLFLYLSSIHVSIHPSTHFSHSSSLSPSVYPAMFFLCHSLYIHVSLFVFLCSLSSPVSFSDWVSILMTFNLPFSNPSFLCRSFLFFPSLFQSLYSYNYLPVIHLYIHPCICLYFSIHPSTYSMLSISPYAFLNVILLSIFLSFSPCLCLSLFLSLSLNSPTSFFPFKIAAYPGILGLTFSSVLSKVKKYVPMCQSYMPC